MSEDAAELARAFARTLEDLRDRHELQYVGAAPLPAPSEPETREERGEGVTSPADVQGSDASPRLAGSAPGSGAPSSTDATRDAESPTAGEAASARSSDAARDAESPTAREAASARPSEDRPSSSATSPEAARGSGLRTDTHGTETSDAGTAPAGPKESTSEPSLTIADPAQREEAAAARRAALREQAKTWSPATKLEFLRRRSVGDCRRCPLARTRNRIVFGVGSPEANLMFIGEAPGADEDRQGEPFVGRAGQLLNRWLQQLQLRREDVYIANVLKCRPPGNRDPRPEEVDRCSPFLQAQIRAIEPKVIVALGRHAGMLLSRREDMTLRAMRSTSRLVYDAGAPKDDPSARMRIPLVVTYHPAYVLRQEGDGRRVPDGRTSPTEMVMTDLRRALAIIRDAND